MFTTDGYVVTGGTINLSGGSGPGGSTQINVSTGNTTIASDIAEGMNNALGKTGAGTLTLAGTTTFIDIVVSGGTLVLQSAGSFANGGRMNVFGASLDAGGNTFATNSVIVQNGNLLNGTISSDNNFHVQISDIGANLAGNGGFRVLGNGIVTLSGNNTFSGEVTANSADAVLIARSNTALGDTTGVTTITNGATLALNRTPANADITIGAEALSLDGTLNNIAGNNTYGGQITLTAASNITSTAGTLTVSNTIDNGGFC